MSIQQRLPRAVARRPATASYRTDTPPPPTALVLGTGDIPSAIGRALFLSGWSVLLLRDNAVPVLRHGMSFDDVLENGPAELDGVTGLPAHTPETLQAMVWARQGVVVANLDPAVVTASRPGLATVLIDARMRKYAIQADLRPLAACTIGIGPGFAALGNVHIAIETLPGHEGGVITAGPTATPTGKAVPLGCAGAERFVYAAVAAAWHPDTPLGT